MPPSSHNPFVRGFDNLSYERVLQIHYDDAYPPCYRSLHPAQKQLPDEAISLQSCLFDDDCAIILDAKGAPDWLEMPSLADGVVNTVVYQVTGQQLGHSHHLGDFSNEDAARQLLEQLSFATGHYSRSWEISSAHLPTEDVGYLRLRTRWRWPAGFFECFALPNSNAVGCKLYSTPWTMEIESGSSSTDEVLMRMHDDLVPPTLLRLLLLAGQADVRFLVFDPDASPLAELPLFTEN
jgi:hypothetical protein